jgi:hypothetical protein
VSTTIQSYLLQLIERSKFALEGKDKTPNDGLLFLGNPQLVFPRLLFDDPVLEPVDRNVWAAIKLHAADGDSVTAFPTYDEIMLRCNIGSKATVSRSISILRACRWLTVCKARLRDARGRVKGNIYALHDEPLQLSETLELDDQYLDFLQGTAHGKQNPHRRAIGIATLVLHDMQSQVHSGIDITAIESPLVRRTQAISWNRRGVEDGQFFAFSKASIAKINSRSYLSNAPFDQVQKLYLVNSSRNSPSTVSVLRANNTKIRGDEYRNCTAAEGVSTETVPRSSSSLYKETTTTETEVSTEIVLTWPAGLIGSNRALVNMQLKTIPPAHHQLVLDALAIKLTAIANGDAKPLIYGILPYTRKLCSLALSGELNPVIPLTPVTPPANAAANDHAVTVQKLNNLSNEIKALQALQKIEPINSMQWAAFDGQITTKKAEWYRCRDLLQAMHAAQT